MENNSLKIGFIGFEKSFDKLAEVFSSNHSLSYYSENIQPDEKAEIVKCPSPEDVAKESDILFVKKGCAVKAVERLGDIIKFKNSTLFVHGSDFSFEEIVQTAGFEINIIKYETAGNLCAVCEKNSEEIAGKIFSGYEIMSFDEKHFPLFYSLASVTQAMTQSFIHSLSSAGEKFGLDADDSKKIAAQTVLGSAKLVNESDEHPIELVDKVCSPGGTTIEGLLSLKKDGFESLLTQTAERIFGD